jgi:GPH family glycoside/pentoside/hexuronide:cation symporter
LSKVASRSTKLFYGSGAAAFGIKDAGFSYFLLAYYNQVLGLDAFLTGLALALAVAIDALSDIFVGYVSDHWRSRWGRRHPFMYFAILPFVISFMALWNPPEYFIESEQNLFLYLLFMAVIVRSFLTFFEVPNASQGPELSSDYDDRTSLMAYRYMFGWLGGLTLSVLSYMVLFNLHPDGQLGPTGYEYFGYIGGSVMLVMMISSSLGTHKHIPGFYYPEKQTKHTISLVFGQFYGLFKNRSFLALFFSGLFFGAATGLATALGIYFGTFFWLLKSTEIGLIPMLGIVAVPVSFFLAPKFANRLGKKKAAMRVFMFAIVFLPLAYIAQLLGLFPARDSAIYLPLLMGNYLIETTAIITTQIIIASMNADLVEDRSAELQGVRHEGLIFATRNFSKKAISGVGIMLAGIILGLVGFPEGANPETISKDIVDNLVLVYLPILLSLYFLSCFIIRFNQIDKQKHEQNLVKSG